MKDRFGQELAVGDRVASQARNYRGLLIATVDSFTPQKVRVKYTNTWNYGKPGVEETFLTEPTNVVKKP